MSQARILMELEIKPDNAKTNNTAGLAISQASVKTAAPSVVQEPAPARSATNVKFFPWIEEKSQNLGSLDNRGFLFYPDMM